MIASIITAAPDFALATFFLAIWIAPRFVAGYAAQYGLDNRALEFGLLTMLLEFVIIHSSAFMGAFIVADTRRFPRFAGIIGLGLFYSMFVGLFSLIFKTWWPFVTFWGLTLNRLMIVLVGQAPEGREQKLLEQSWAMSVALYLLTIFATTLLPVPAFGITPEIIAEHPITGSGVWVEEPYRVIAAAFIYFFGQGIYEVFLAERWVDETPMHQSMGKKRGPAKAGPR